MRLPFIAGNWKMNKTLEEADLLLKEIKNTKLPQGVEVCVCVPFIALERARDLLKDSPIKLGAQNMYFESEGAFTGEISPSMLASLGVDYVIIGHSERREIFHESDEWINKKVKAALNHSLRPILCCGETLEEREAGRAEEKVIHQVRKGLEGVSAEELDQIVIAYEPIWAIGTGKTASSKDAQMMARVIRNLLEELYSKDRACSLRIQYGGSVKPDNIQAIMNEEDVDGALVGGASLDASDFSKLIHYQSTKE